jgi:hypothetical protein
VPRNAKALKCVVAADEGIVLAHHGIASTTD